MTDEKSVDTQNCAAIDFNNCDCIEINHIRVAGPHGVSASERAACLPLEVNIKLKIDLSLAERTDELQDTINYSMIRMQVADVVERSSHRLLERLAADILDDVFGDKRIEAARVSISKPERLGGATPTVTLVRRNSNFQ